MHETCPSGFHDETVQESMDSLTKKLAFGVREKEIVGDSNSLVLISHSNGNIGLFKESISWTA